MVYSFVYNRKSLNTKHQSEQKCLIIFESFKRVIVHTGHFFFEIENRKQEILSINEDITHQN